MASGLLFCPMLETHAILILISLHSFQVEIDKGAALDKFQHWWCFVAKGQKWGWSRALSLIYPLIFLPPLCLSLCLLKCYVSKQMQELLHLYKLKWENTNCFLSLGHIYHFRSSKGKKYVLLLFCVFTSSKGKDMRHHLKEDRWDVTLQNNQAISKGEIWHPSEEAALHGFYVQSYYFINYVQRVAIDEGRSTNKSAI